jgi:hypothetical protein
MVTSASVVVDTGTNTTFLILVVWLTSVVDMLLCKTVVTIAATVLFREELLVK